MVGLVNDSSRRLKRNAKVIGSRVDFASVPLTRDTRVPITAFLASPAPVLIHLYGQFASLAALSSCHHAP